MSRRTTHSSISIPAPITTSHTEKRSRPSNKRREYCELARNLVITPTSPSIFAVRNTPQTTHGTSPTQRLMNRRTKTHLPTSGKLVKPKINRRARELIRRRQDLQRKYYNRRDRQLSPLKEGDVHKIKEMEKRTVIRQVGILSYEVESNGSTYTRNRRFLRKSAIKEDSDDYTDQEEPEMAEAEMAVTTTTNTIETII